MGDGRWKSVVFFVGDGGRVGGGGGGGDGGVGVVA